MKRVLLFLLCFTMILSLGACGETEKPEGPTDTVFSGFQTAGGTASTSSDTPDDSSSVDGTEKEPEPVVFDPEAEHKFIATDIRNHSIVVFDLNPCDGDFKKLTEDELCVVWEWDADDDPECKMKPGSSIDAAKIRYSSYYERDVMIGCSSNGWAGVIDYEEKSLLWEAQVGDGNGPHSIEMLPNGDVVVACSGSPGALVYVPLSAGEVDPVSSIPSAGCHGVSWDPENEWLWVLEDTGIYAATVINMGTAQGIISRVGGTGALFGNGVAGGHAFSPVYGEQGKYWASSGAALWQFDTATETLSRNYPRASTLNYKPEIKGIASFPDGTVVQTVVNVGGNASWDWSCDGFCIFIRQKTSGKVQTVREQRTVVCFDPEEREFYKVQPFNKNYR